MIAAAVAALLYTLWLWKAVHRLPDVSRILRSLARPEVRKQPPLPHLALFLVVFAGLLLFSPQVEAGLHLFLRLTLYLGTFLMLVCLRQLSPRYRRTRPVVHAILLGAVIDAVYGLYQVHVTGQLHATGFGSHYTPFGSLLVTAILLATALLLAARRPPRRAVYSGVVCVCAVALVCSQARGPWIALAVSCPIVITLSRRRLARDRTRAVTYLGAAAALTVALAPLYLGRLRTIFDPKWVSNSERILIWTSTLHMIRDHPLIGVGEGRFAAIYNAHYISRASVEGWHPHAHNTFLMILAENGIIGFAATLYLLYGIVLFLRAALRDAPSDPYVIGTVGVLCALLVNSLVDYFLFSGHLRSEWVFWLMLGLVYYDRPAPRRPPAGDLTPQAAGCREKTLA
ncbi:MAG: O-antigen ligase family protein [Armatimonadetes bacterium]|nr:O-antigen ligase family protein [Armatimonadota bacterium]